MVAILEKWISVEFDHLIGDATNVDPITDRFCDKQHDLIANRALSGEENPYVHTYHGRQDVCQSTLWRKLILDTLIE
jgi:hypothetical protein